MARALPTILLATSLVASCAGRGPSPQTAPVVPASVAAPRTVPPPPSLPSIDESALDSSVDPCDDFYRYACGGWMKANPIPDDRTSWGRGSQLNEKNLERLRAILEHDAAGGVAGEAEANKLGDYFAACMDEAAVEKRGTRELEPELARIDAIHDARSLGKALAHLHLLGVFPFFAIDAASDYSDPTRMTLAMSQGGLGLPERDYYLDPPGKADPRKKEVRAAYQGHVQRVLALLGAPPAKASAGAQKVLALETKLAEGSLTNVALRDPHNQYHHTDRQWLRDNAPAFGWDDYFAELGLADVTGLNVAQPDFLKAAGAVVRSTPLADVRTYLRWHLLHGIVRALPARFVDEDFKYQQVIGGQRSLAPRWKRCVREINDGMGEALAQPFVKEVLGEDGKAEARATIFAIAAAMRENLAHVSWMDDATRRSAIEKIDALTKKIAYPDKWRSYDGLAIDRASYFADVTHAATFEMRRKMAKVDKPVDPNEWGTTPPTVDAFYEPTRNEIVFPAGILQPPFFGLSMTRAMRYGAVGVIAGHEVTHGFDDEGRQFDGTGRLRDFWSPKVAQDFVARAQCIVDQYNAYTVLDGVHVNGQLTLGEDIADLGGMKLAYAAFEARKQDGDGGGDLYVVPEEKQFFIGYGQAWCRNIRDEQLHTMVSTDAHAPPGFRVQGVLSNTPEFAAAFACKPGSRMVRANRCEVW